MTEEDVYDIAFSFESSLTVIEKKTLFNRYGSVKEIFKLSKSGIKSIIGRGWQGHKYDPEKFLKDAEKTTLFIEKTGIKIARFDEPLYPKSLTFIPDLPFLIYYKGNISYNYEKSIAIVGTREPDDEGTYETEKISDALAKNGFSIVSGLAKGIDSISHSMAIKNGGKTLAILGCGIDRTYPAENRALARDILDNDGAIISEYPPGVPPQKWFFPRRNRIIVGLSRATLIMQAPKKSGSLITAVLCADYDKDLFVYKSIDENKALFEGNNNLIENGAKAIKDEEDIINELTIR